MLQEIASVKKRINTIGSEWVNTQSQDLAYHSERLFKPELRPHGSINMVKLLSSRFEQGFGPFTMLFVEVSSERGSFRNLSNHAFRST